MPQGHHSCGLSQPPHTDAHTQLSPTSLNQGSIEGSHPPSKLFFFFGGLLIYILPRDRTFPNCVASFFRAGGQGKVPTCPSVATCPILLREAEDLPPLLPFFFERGSSYIYFPEIGPSQIALPAVSRVVARVKSQVLCEFPVSPLGHFALGHDGQIPEPGNSNLSSPMCTFCRRGLSRILTLHFLTLAVGLRTACCFRTP